MAKSKSNQSSKSKSSSSTGHHSTKASTKPSSSSSKSKSKSSISHSKSKSSNSRSPQTDPPHNSDSITKDNESTTPQFVAPRPGPERPLGPNRAPWSEWLWSERWQMCYRGRRDFMNEWEYEWRELPPAPVKYLESDLKIIYGTRNSQVSDGKDKASGCEIGKEGKEGGVKKEERKEGAGKDEGKKDEKSGMSLKGDGKETKGSVSDKKTEKKIKRKEKQFDKEKHFERGRSREVKEWRDEL